MSADTHDPENVKKFLHELAKLTKHYGILISGCGCCDSPFLCDLKNEKLGPGGYAVNRNLGMRWTRE